MAGYASYTAVLDACVLYSVTISDALVSLAAEGLFAAKWTRRIEDEWIRNLEQKRPDLAGKLDRRSDAMRNAIPDWEVPAAAWQSIKINAAFPDRDDEHVVAAAVAGHADCIVTLNLSDFTVEITNRLDLEMLHPDQFIVAQWDLSPMAAAVAFKRMRERWNKPKASATDFADILERNSLPSTVNRLRQAFVLS